MVRGTWVLGKRYGRKVMSRVRDLSKRKRRTDLPSWLFDSLYISAADACIAITHLI